MSQSSLNSLPEADFDYCLWRQLQEKVILKRELTEVSERNNQEIENCCNPNQEVYLIESDIRRKQCLIEHYKSSIRDLRLLCIRRQRALKETLIVIERQKNDTLEFVESIDQNGVQCIEKEKELDAKINALGCLRELSVSRKIHLIVEIRDIFKLGIEGVQARAQRLQKCTCGICVSIRGYHLPDISSWPAHDDAESFCAIEHTIHLMLSLAKTLDYPIRYPVYQDLGETVLMVPIEEEKIIPLKGWRGRYERERFYVAIQLLGKNVAQLRSDTGIHTLVTNNILLILSELIFAFSEGNCQTHYNRPKLSIQSLASLISENEQDNMTLLANSI